MVIKFDEDSKTIGISPVTKSNTYQYVGKNSNVQFTIGISEYSTEKYSDNYRSFATKAKNGKDLTVSTLFYDITKNAPKFVTTTIKDFFSEGLYQWAEVPNYDLNLANATKVSPADTATYYTVSEDGTDFSDNADFILASSVKDAELHLTKGGGDTVYDTKGADYYYMEADY